MQVMQVRCNNVVNKNEGETVFDYFYLFCVQRDVEGDVMKIQLLCELIVLRKVFAMI